MKRLLFVTFLLISVLYAFSQNDEKELAFYSENNLSGNTVKKTILIEAEDNFIIQKNLHLNCTSLVKQDNAIQHNYEYYNNLYLKAKNMRNTGISLTFLSIPVTVLGIIMNNNNAYTNSSQNGAITFENIGAGGFFVIGGDILFNVGVPLWIAGSIKAKNNKIARDKSSLTTFQISAKGLGGQLTLHF